MKGFRLLTAALGLLGALHACQEQRPRIDLESAIPVRVEPVGRQYMAAYVSAMGTLEPQRQAVLRAQQSGRYTLNANPRTGAPYVMGDAVKAGETVVQLTNEEFVNQVAIDARQLQFTSAQREYEKQVALFDKGGITLSERTAAERALIDARYAYENARLQLAKLRAVAPLTGRLVSLPHYSPGELVETGADLATIMDCRELFTNVSLPGKELERVKPGQKVLVTHYGDAAPDTLIGRVAQVSPVLDTQSRMFTARIYVTDDSLRVRPGIFVKVDIVVMERDSVLVVDRDVVLETGSGKQVFVVEQGLALERRLETGLSNRDQLEVLSGLEERDLLVVEGFETLRNRARVRIQK